MVAARDGQSGRLPRNEAGSLVVQIGRSRAETTPAKLVCTRSRKVRLEESGQGIAQFVVLRASLDIAELGDKAAGDLELAVNFAATNDLHQHEIHALAGRKHDGRMAIGEEVRLAKGNSSARQILREGGERRSGLLPPIVERNHLD